MAYSFKQSDRSVGAGLRRIALDQIDSGIAETRDGDLSRSERVHQVRKRCKKLRGLIRLIRPGFPAYSHENAAFRDAARRLSDIRDAAALVETCDLIDTRFRDQLSADAFAAIRAHFADRARRIANSAGTADRLDRMRADLQDARGRAADWTLSVAAGDEETDAVTGGLARTYARACAAMATAQDAPTGKTLHDWRKRTKYHWYHLRLLKAASPILEAAVDEVGRLSDVLGEHHDLHVMEAAMARAGDIADPPTVEAFRGLLGARRAQLESAAFARGRALFSEPSAGLADRVDGYWRAWSAAT